MNSGDPISSGLMLLIGLFCAPLVLLAGGFTVMVAAAHMKNWLARPRGPELIVPSWRITEQHDRRVVVEGDDPVACAEDGRLAVAALLAADRELVAALRAKAGPRVLTHGNTAEGSEGAKTVVERVPDPSEPTARAEAVALAKQFAMPVKNNRDSRK